MHSRPYHFGEKDPKNEHKVILVYYALYDYIVGCAFMHGLASNLTKSMQIYARYNVMMS